MAIKRHHGDPPTTLGPLPVLWKSEYSPIKTKTSSRPRIRNFWILALPMRRLQSSVFQIPFLPSA